MGCRPNDKKLAGINSDQILSIALNEAKEYAMKMKSFVEILVINRIKNN